MPAEAILTLVELEVVQQKVQVDTDVSAYFAYSEAAAQKWVG